MPRAVFAGLASTLTVGGLLAVLWGVGVIGGGPNVKSSLERDEAATSKKESDEKASADADEKDASVDALPPPVEMARGGDAAVAPASGGALAASSDMTAQFARTLAVQISQKSSYNFDPRFADFIKSSLNEYRGATGYSERATKYRDAIDREFVNAQGIPPLVAYLIAMSQSKFVEKPGTGVWNLPPAVLSSYSTGANADLNDPAVSTRVAAQYVRSLLDVFGKEDFMYAVACYGMTIDEAGKLKTTLEEKDPAGQMRGDFWKMKNAGVVKDEQVTRVARFFAAGIVGENPTQFGLKEKPFSSFY